MSIPGYGFVADSLTFTTEIAGLGVSVPSGKVVLGGGAAAPDTRAVMFANEPDFENGVAVGWQASARNTDTTGGAMTLRVYCFYADS